MNAKQIQCCECGDQIEAGLEVKTWEFVPDHWCRNCADDMMVEYNQNPDDYNWGGHKHPDEARLMAAEKRVYEKVPDDAIVYPSTVDMFPAAPPEVYPSTADLFHAAV